MNLMGLIVRMYFTLLILAVFYRPCDSECLGDTCVKDVPMATDLPLQNTTAAQNCDSGNWGFSRIINTRMKHNKTIVAGNEEECLRECQDETDFPCYSASFDTCVFCQYPSTNDSRNGTCHLSTASYSSDAESFQYNPFWISFAFECYDCKNKSSIQMKRTQGYTVMQTLRGDDVETESDCEMMCYYSRLCHSAVFEYTREGAMCYISTSSLSVSETTDKADIFAIAPFAAVLEKPCPEDCEVPLDFLGNISTAVDNLELRRGDLVPHGTVLTVECPKYYSPQAKNVECSFGRFSTQRGLSVQLCVRDRCAPPPVKSLYYVVRKDEYRRRDTVKIVTKCPGNQHFVGEQFLTCLEDGYWDGFAECRPYCHGGEKYLLKKGDHYLRGADTKTVNVETEDECVDACIAETDFLCLSVDYWNYECILSDKSHLTHPDKLAGVNIWQRSWTYIAIMCDN